MKKIESQEEMMRVLEAFDQVFDPPLSEAISDLKKYADKQLKEAVTYVADIGRKEAGFISFSIRDSGQEAAEIGLIAVLPDYQGQRLAQKLLDKCIQVARKKGKKKVRIELDEFNERALAFFEKHDFEVVEETSNNTVYMERVLS